MTKIALISRKRYAFYLMISLKDAINVVVFHVDLKDAVVFNSIAQIF